MCILHFTCMCKWTYNTHTYKQGHLSLYKRVKQYLSGAIYQHDIKYMYVDNRKVISKKGQ